MIPVGTDGSTVPIPTFAEAVEEVSRRKILNDFNECYKGDVPGLEKWGSVTPQPISNLTRRINNLTTTTVAAWNIKQGGGTRLARITNRLRELNPDVVVLSEHGGSKSRRVCDALKEAGWHIQASSDSSERPLGVLIASRVPFVPLSDQVQTSLDRQRCLAVEFPGFTLVGLYFPLIPVKAKNAFWEGVLAYARESHGRPCLLIGDFNTTKHFVDEIGKSVPGSKHLEALENLGWTECWRLLNPSISLIEICFQS